MSFCLFVVFFGELFLCLFLVFELCTISINGSKKLEFLTIKIAVKRSIRPDGSTILLVCFAVLVAVVFAILLVIVLHLRLPFHSARCSTATETKCGLS